MPRVVFKSPAEANEQHVRKVNKARDDLVRQVAKAVGVFSCDVYVRVTLSKPRRRLLVDVIFVNDLPLHTKDDLKAIIAEQVKAIIEGNS
jgi:hypothetical protein